MREAGESSRTGGGSYKGAVSPECPEEGWEANWSLHPLAFLLLCPSFPGQLSFSFPWAPGRASKSHTYLPQCGCVTTDLHGPCLFMP